MNKLSKEELDKLVVDLAELCKSKGITKEEEIEKFLNKELRDLKLNDLLGE